MLYVLLYAATGINVAVSRAALGLLGEVLPRWAAGTAFLAATATTTILNFLTACVFVAFRQGIRRRARRDDPAIPPTVFPEEEVA